MIHITYLHVWLINFPLLMTCHFQAGCLEITLERSLLCVVKIELLPIETKISLQMNENCTTSTNSNYKLRKLKQKDINLILHFFIYICPHRIKVKVLKFNPLIKSPVNWKYRKKKDIMGIWNTILYKNKTQLFIIHLPDKQQAQNQPIFLL